MNNLEAKIKGFIVRDFLFGNEDGVKDDTLLLDEGIIDSTGVLELVNFVEEEFSISVEDEELVPENLGSIKNIVSYLSKKFALTEPAGSQGKQG